MLKVYEPTKGEEVYHKLRSKLMKMYDADDYVVINPRTSKYFVGETSVEAMKRARKKYPTGKLFLAQVGRIAGLLK